MKANVLAWLGLAWLFVGLCSGGVSASGARSYGTCVYCWESCFFLVRQKIMRGRYREEVFGFCSGTVRGLFGCNPYVQSRKCLSCNDLQHLAGRAQT